MMWSLMSPDFSRLALKCVALYMGRSHRNGVRQKTVHCFPFLPQVFNITYLIMFLYTCYHLSKADNGISFLKINKVLLYCTVLYYLCARVMHCLPSSFSSFSGLCAGIVHYLSSLPQFSVL